MIDYVFLNLNIDFIFFTILFSAAIASVIMMQCLMALKNRIIKFKFVFTVFSIVASLSILIIPTYVFFKMYNDGLGDSDIDRLISSGYLNYEVLIQIKKDINESYDGLECMVDDELINSNRKFLINYKRINKAIYNLEDIKKNSVINRDGLEVEQVKIDRQKRIEIIQNSREEFNEKIDKLINLKATQWIA